MDKLNHYRSLIKNAMCKSPYYVYGTSLPNEETLFLCDEGNDLYMLFDLGWRGEKRVNNIVLLIRIKNDKVWIEDDWTEEGIANELLRAGVPNEDIVLGFQHPTMRPYTDFAVA